MELDGTGLELDEAIMKLYIKEWWKNERPGQNHFKNSDFDRVIDHKSGTPEF